MWPSGVVATLELALGAEASTETGTGACGSSAYHFCIRWYLDRTASLCAHALTLRGEASNRVAVGKVEMGDTFLNLYMDFLKSI